MPNRFALREGIEVGLQLLWLDAVIAGEPFECGLRFAQCAVKLGAVARRKDRSLPDWLTQSQLRKRRSEALGVKCHALAYRKGSGLVIQSERE